jgi:WD40 repeat protein
VGGLRIIVSIAATLAVFAATLVGNSASIRAAEKARLVPQLELTDLSPRKVAFAPDDASSLLVVNQTGRIDLFDISNPGRPAKTSEIATNALDAAFSPNGASIVSSGGEDGAVRLWTLDGKPAAEPFKGHNGTVLSVAFSPDGARIVSSGEDGTVRLWTLDGKPAAEPFKGHNGAVSSVAFSPNAGD